MMENIFHVKNVYTMSYVLSKNIRNCVNWRTKRTYLVWEINRNATKGLKMIFADRSTCYLFYVANQHSSVPRTKSVSQECAVHYYFKI